MKRNSILIAVALSLNVTVSILPKLEKSITGVCSLQIAASPGRDHPRQG
jgi:hypothetical protein